MKKLALLFALTLCATAFAPKAKAQGCAQTFDCDTPQQCFQCHIEWRGKRDCTDSFCIGCNEPPCAGGLTHESPQITEEKRRKRAEEWLEVKAHPFTAIGEIFKTMARFNSLTPSPRKATAWNLPEGHPDVTGYRTRQMQYELSGKLKSCAAPKEIQTFIASMLRK